MAEISTMYAKDGELRKLQQTLKRTVRLCKMIWQYRDYIEEIKGHIEREELTAASELWNELDYSVQESLSIAPTKGGAFTTKERAIISGFWKLTVADIEGTK